MYTDSSELVLDKIFHVVLSVYACSILNNMRAYFIIKLTNLKPVCIKVHSNNSQTPSCFRCNIGNIDVYVCTCSHLDRYGTAHNCKFYISWCILCKLLPSNNICIIVNNASEYITFCSLMRNWVIHNIK